ncbi:MAG: SIS domain-containing protein [Clostridiales bacterium]|jgi:D-sedoheptulose 7-phosphate isomerase|nr:SIS domain-containing protein [Clostridiales bacterium]
MKPNTVTEINRFFEEHKKLLSQRDAVARAIETLTACYKNGGKVLLCGNGGSSADCDHIAGELLKSFKLKRRPDAAFAAKAESLYGANGRALADNLEQGLPAVSLTAQTAFMTAFLNDRDAQFLYAQGVTALGRAGDVLIGISTSGNAKNVAQALRTARVKDMATIGLAGNTGGAIKELADVCILSPEKETYKIQEDHLPVYHLLCAAVESELFDE